MSLLVLMYHRAREGRHGNSPEMLAAHLAYLAGTYPNVLPGDALEPGRLNVCLSFDDGYFDFYATVFPLLRKHRLRALLAIPPGVVRERVSAGAGERLRVETDDAFAAPQRGGFCTWSELREMTSSGLVRVAAHGFTHCRLDGTTADLGQEVETPKTVLEVRLGQRVESFVFPFGRYSGTSMQRARRNYRHVFRIGGALNRSWKSRLIYRVDADAMTGPRSLFSPSRRAGYWARFAWNRLRRR